MRYGASLLFGNTYHSNSYSGDSQTRHHYPTQTSSDSVINMNKVFGILVNLSVLWVLHPLFHCQAAQSQTVSEIRDTLTQTKQLIKFPVSVGDGMSLADIFLDEENVIIYQLEMDRNVLKAMNDGGSTVTFAKTFINTTCQDTVRKQYTAKWGKFDVAVEIVAPNKKRLMKVNLKTDCNKNTATKKSSANGNAKKSLTDLIGKAAKKSLYKKQETGRKAQKKRYEANSKLMPLILISEGNSLKPIFESYVSLEKLQDAIQNCWHKVSLTASERKSLPRITVELKLNPDTTFNSLRVSDSGLRVPQKSAPWTDNEMKTAVKTVNFLTTAIHSCALPKLNLAKETYKYWHTIHVKLL